MAGWRARSGCRRDGRPANRAQPSISGGRRLDSKRRVQLAIRTTPMTAAIDQARLQEAPPPCRPRALRAFTTPLPIFPTASFWAALKVVGRRLVKRCLTGSGSDAASAESARIAVSPMGSSQGFVSRYSLRPGGAPRCAPPCRPLAATRAPNGRSCSSARARIPPSRRAMIPPARSARPRPV